MDTQTQVNCYDMKYMLSFDMKHFFNPLRPELCAQIMYYFAQLTFLSVYLLNYALFSTMSGLQIEAYATPFQEVNKVKTSLALSLFLLGLGYRALARG